MNRRAQEAIQDFCEKRLDKHIEFWPEALEKKAILIGLISRLINGPSENIALTPNTSAGLNILANGLEWKKGDRRRPKCISCNKCYEAIEMGKPLACYMERKNKTDA